MGGRLEGWKVSSICVFLVRVFRSQDGGVGTGMVRVFVCVFLGYSRFGGDGLGIWQYLGGPSPPFRLL